jgi:hypothetical protein
VQLQKTLFLFGKEMRNAISRGYYKFKPYHYGAFDRAIYADAEELQRDGLIIIEPPFGGRNRVYTVTDEGTEIAANLNVNNKARRYLKRLMLWAQSLSFAQLVASVYRKYPTTRRNSIFVE